MPKIPSFRKQRLPSANVGAAPLPVSAANVAGGAIGQGLQSLGRGIGDVASTLQLLKDRDDKNKDSIATDSLNHIVKEENDKFDLRKAGEGDTSKWPELDRQRNENIKMRAGAELSFSSDKVSAEAMAYLDRLATNSAAKTAVVL